MEALLAEFTASLLPTVGAPSPEGPHPCSVRSSVVALSPSTQSLEAKIKNWKEIASNLRKQYGSIK